MTVNTLYYSSLGTSGMDWMWSAAANATWKCCFCVFYRRRTEFCLSIYALFQATRLLRENLWFEDTEQGSRADVQLVVLRRDVGFLTYIFSSTGAGPWEGQLKWTRSMRLPCMCLRAARCCSVTPETPELSQNSASCCRFSASPCRAWCAVSVDSICALLLWL